jgi:hypothetical protein
MGVLVWGILRYGGESFRYNKFISTFYYSK